MSLTRVKGKVLDTAVNTINDLPTTGYDGQVIEVLGYHTAGDGGGGTFRFSTTSATNNGGTIILPSLTMPDYTATAGNCWHRQYSGAVNVKWFGAKGGSVNSSSDTSAVQAALTSIGTNASTVEFIVDTTIHLNNSIEIDRNLSDAFEFRGFLVIRGIGTQAGFYSTINGNMFTSVSGQEAAYIRFENVFFGSDHSTGTYVIDFDNMRRIFFNGCYFNEIQLNSTARYVQQLSLVDCIIYNWAGTFSDCLAFYDLTVIGCDFEAGLGTEAKGFTAYDALSTNSTQTASFLSCTFENAAGPFIALQDARGVIVSGCYFEAVTNQVLDFQQGTPKGVIVTGNGFDTGIVGANDDYAPIVVSYPNGFTGSNNWATRRIYRFLNEMDTSANAFGGSFGTGDFSSAGDILSTTSPISNSNRLRSGVQIFRPDDETQHIQNTIDGSGVHYGAENSSSATYLPIDFYQKSTTGNVSRLTIDTHMYMSQQDDISQRLNFIQNSGLHTLQAEDTDTAIYPGFAVSQKCTSGTRSNLKVKPDGTVALNVSTAGVTLDENATLAFFQASPTSVGLVLRASDGVERIAVIPVA